MVVCSGKKWGKVGDSMLVGQFRHSIDAKGRIIIPAQFRKALSEEFMLCRGFDGCLSLFTLEQFEEHLALLRKLPPFKRDVRNFVRSTTSSAVKCNPDTQGRILIPSHLIELAEILKECVFVGVDNHVELWSKERWEPINEEANSKMEEYAESIEFEF